MKPENLKKLRDRAANAIRGMYHNANLPWIDPEMPGHLAEFLSVNPDRYAWGWVCDTARFEIEYIEGGGAYGPDYRATLSAECNAGRYTSYRARAYYVAKGMRAMRLERAKHAAWERISEYGGIYQWGRGGRTVAPDGLIRQSGASWCCDDSAPDDMSPAALTELCLIVESFNCFVRDTCAAFPEMWREHLADIQADYDAAEKAERIEAAIVWEESRPDMYGVAP